VLFAFERDLDLADLRHVAAEARAVLRGEPLARHRAGTDHRRGQPRRRAPAAARVAQAVLLQVGVVGVPGTEARGDLRVVLAALVLVAHEERDRRSRRATFEHAAQDLDAVLLAALRDVPRRAGLPAVEVGLDVGFRQRHSRRATVHHAADRRAVGFAEGGDGEEGT
jgi:hypothetical protein